MPVNNPKHREENAKSKKWQVPMDMENAKPQEYPEKVGGKNQKVRSQKIKGKKQ